MVKPGGKKTRGRQRIEMHAIERREKRQVTFSKRKAGLLKKASEISLLCGAHVAVVAFSGVGRPFALRTGNGSAYAPPLHPVFAADDGPNSLVDDPRTVQALVRATEEREEEARAEKVRLDQVGEAVVQAQALAGKTYWWETDPEALGPVELPEFTKALQRLRDNVRRRIDHPLPRAVDAAATTPRVAHQSFN